MRRLCLLLSLTACGAPSEGAGPAFIAPMDGQTAVPVDLDLLVSTGGMELPPEQPVSPDVVRVVDLDVGGLVEGALWRDGDDLRFTPDGGWVAGHRYLWTVANPPPDSRQPQLGLSAEIQGDAGFQVVDGVAALDAGIDPLGGVCILLSRPAIELPALAIELDGKPVDAPLWEIRPEGARGSSRLLPNDPGVSLACWIDPPRLSGGEELRVWWDDQGPWRYTLDHVEAEALGLEQRRHE